MKYNFNQNIKEALKEKGISINDGIGCLVLLYFGIKTTYMPDKLVTKIFSSDILTINHSSQEIEWKMPLFEEVEVGFEWIGEWMDLFKAVNPSRRGNKGDVLKRMKKFFINNPSVRKDEVFDAANRYLNSIINPTYCKKSSKFINEADGSSMLLDYIEEYKNRNSYNEDII